MSKLLELAWHSAWHRRFALSLVVLSLALSAFLLLGLERVRHDVRQNFAQSVSGTDLIVGARGGAVNLLLHAVFRTGQGTPGMRLSSAEALAQDKAVAWVVPLALGDSHRGFPVVATTTEYFERFRYGTRRTLELQEGSALAQAFDDEHHAVIGADVAQRLGYRPGQKLVLSHGSGALDTDDHDAHPFTVAAVLKRTGTPVDRSVHISLEAMQELHESPMQGPPMVNAALVGLKTRAAVFAVQRRVAEFEGEPLMAVMPAVALDELWDTLAGAERALQLVSALVGAVSLAGLVATVLAALEQRRRELAVLRTLGAGPARVLTLLMLEGALVSITGALLGLLAWWLALLLASPWVAAHHGVLLSTAPPRMEEGLLLLAVVAAGTLSALLPGWRAYRLSLADGLSPQGA